MTKKEGRILVTGGAGFIGSAVVWALNLRGRDDILVSDFLEPKNRRSASDFDLKEKARNLEPLRYADYVEADRLRRLVSANDSILGTIDTVFHLGACSATTETDAAYLDDNNLAYTQELAKWALTRGARFIYASSAATYGDGNQGMDDKTEDLIRLKPLNLYGWSKQNFDLHAQKEGWLGQIVGLKYFNVFGPNEGHKADMRSLVHKAYQQILDTGKVKLFKSHRSDYRDGEQKRDFLYVKDAVEMTLHFAEGGRQAGGLYNLGSGEANTWITLANSIFAALGRDPKIEFIEMPEVLRDKYQYFTQASIEKLRKAGYTRPVTALPLAVKDYVQNYLIPRKFLGQA